MTFLLNFTGFFIGLVLGCYILFVGRKHLWATLGIAALAASGDLLAILVAGLENGRALIDAQNWLLVGIAVLIGVLGVVLGHSRPDLATYFIGFIAGADAAIWFYDISNHILTTMANQPEYVAFWTGIAILIVGGLLGLWLIKTIRDEALIFITMVVGIRLIQTALGLDKTNGWTAIIMLSFALAGVLIQYAVYLREIKANQTKPEFQASSIAYFQDLELH